MDDIAAGAGAVSSDGDGPFALRIAEVRRETADAVSLLLAVPAPLADHFAYRAGQYVTLEVAVDGRTLRRCYSMCSAPEAEGGLRIAIRRVADGRVSRWADTCARAGDTVAVLPPEGRFCLRDRSGAVVLIGAGSGVTPLISLARSALASTARPVKLLLANRDRASILFADELAALARDYPDRFRLTHWLDDERGLMSVAGLAALAPFVPGADHYLCGPDGYLDLVRGAAVAAGVDAEHLFVERFASAPDGEGTGLVEAPADDPSCERLTLILAGRPHVVAHRPGETIVEAARRGGLRPPVSCQVGACATCMARVTQGVVRMYANDVLTPSEVAEGYTLTCQAVPVSDQVTVEYEP